MFASPPMGVVKKEIFFIFTSEKAGEHALMNRAVYNNIHAFASVEFHELFALEYDSGKRTNRTCVPAHFRPNNNNNNEKLERAQ